MTWRRTASGSPSARRASSSFPRECASPAEKGVLGARRLPLAPAPARIPRPALGPAGAALGAPALDARLQRHGRRARAAREGAGGRELGTVAPAPTRGLRLRGGGGPRRGDRAQARRWPDAFGARARPAPGLLRRLGRLGEAGSALCRAAGETRQRPLAGRPGPRAGDVLGPGPARPP